MENIKRNKVLRHYRLEPLIYDELKKVLEKLNVTETSFIEMAIIEKIAHIQAKNEQDNKLV